MSGRKALVLLLAVVTTESVPTLNLFGGGGGNNGGSRTRCRPGYEYVTETSYETSYEQQCSTRCKFTKFKIYVPLQHSIVCDFSFFQLRE